MNIAFPKSKAFAVRIVNLYSYLTTTKGEYIISKQLLRSGTSIGANIAEAQYAISKPDFISKQQIVQTKIMEKVVDCNREILYTISRDCNAEDIKLELARLATKLVNDIHTDLIGFNTYTSKESSVVDLIDVRIGFYKDSVIKYITNTWFAII